MFKVRIQTPDKTHFDGEAESLTVATEEGLLQIYPHHADLVGAVGFSHAWVQVTPSHREHFLVRHGVLTVSTSRNEAALLCFASELKEKADKKSLKEYLEFLEKLVASNTSLSDFQVRFVKGEIDSLEQMIEVVSVGGN